MTTPATRHQLTTNDHSVAVTIQQHATPETEAGNVPMKIREPWSGWRLLYLPSLFDHLLGHDQARRLIHGIKVAIAIVLVSLLYMVDVIHDRLGDNLMWAIMTVVVMFELTSGGTLRKGVNRGFGTLCGGLLGMLVALWAHDIGGWGRTVLVSFLLFIICTAASYFRMIPNIKKGYDYGVMIFILTFSLVAVSGVRGDQIIKQANDRLSAILIGMAISVTTNMLIFPVWAGDELQTSLESNFKSLASSIQGTVDDYFKPVDEKLEGQPLDTSKGCKSVIHSKASNESMALFAKWEPMNRRFGHCYPWDDYLVIANLLRNLAISILSLRDCRRYKNQGDSTDEIKKQCESMSDSIGSMLTKLGAHFHNRTKSVAADDVDNLESHKQKLFKLICHLDIDSGNEDDIEGAQIAQFLLVLINIIDRMEELVIKVEELGKAAAFS